MGCQEAKGKRVIAMRISRRAKPGKLAFSAEAGRYPFWPA